MRFRFWLGFAAVLAIALASVLGALVVRAHERNSFEREQEDEASRSAHQAEAVAALSIGQLTSTGAFYEAEERFDSHQFDVLASPLLAHGGLTGTAFIARVPGSRRAAYERTRGFPIVERLGQRLARAGARAEYFPVTFSISKPDGGERERPALGYDLGADPRRGPVLREARDSGKPAATGVIPFVTRPGNALVVYQPVYRDGAPTDTVAERRAALIGFASGAFKVGDLAAAAASTNDADANVQLLQGTRRIAGDRGSFEDGARAPIRLADRTWLLVLHDPSGPSLGLPILMAVVGISLAALLGALILVWSRNEQVQELEREAGQDPLTGLKNRRGFEDDLRRELAHSHRQGSPGAMLMIDLDHFKQVNDTRGHPAGDRLIGEIADVLRRRTRESDVLARLGGDEFAIVLPHTRLTEARIVAEAIIDAIREHSQRDGEEPVTASIGVAMFGEGPIVSPELIVSSADTAMYAAKDGGRDGVRVFDPLAISDDVRRG